LRLLSVLTGAVAIPLTFWALLPALGKRVALLSALACAASFILTWYSREVRNYILFFTLAMATFGFFMRLLRYGSGPGRRRHLAGFAVALILCLYTHHNALLMAPAFGVLFFAWEAMHRRFRRGLFGQLVAVALVFLVMAIPVFMQLYAWRWDLDKERIRPGLDQLYLMLGSIGWGTGWRFPFCLAVLLGGAAALVRTSRAVAFIFVFWLLFPIVMYLYVLGMPPKFTWFVFRYIIFLQIALIALSAACMDGAARLLDAWRVGARKPVPYRLGIVLSAVAILSVFWTPYSLYYRMKASQEVRKEIIATLKTGTGGRVLVDNYYYWSGSLKQFMPPEIRVAYPPVFSGEEDYAGHQVPAFIREACERDPLLGFMETGARGYARKQVSWDWQNSHFSHRTVLLNEKGRDLALLGLNYFSYLSIGAFSNYCFRFNTAADLPAWFKNRNKTEGVVPGKGWVPFTFLEGDTMRWNLWYAMDAESTILVYSEETNTIVSLAFNVQTCGTDQQLSVCTAEGTLLYGRTVRSDPAYVTRFATKKTERGYLPVTRLVDQNEGAFPFFALLKFSVIPVRTRPVAVPKGLSVFRLQCVGGGGLVMSDLAVEKVD
jgi:hypothetical protein